MRSSRYQILPRAQYRERIGLWVVVWKDPGDLMQTRNTPLKYVREYVGVGRTYEEAAKQCRMHYLSATLEKAAAEWRRETFERDCSRASVKPKLPWWKRLFRV